MAYFKWGGGGEADLLHVITTVKHIVVCRHSTSYRDYYPRHNCKGSNDMIVFYKCITQVMYKTFMVKVETERWGEKEIALKSKCYRLKTMVTPSKYTVQLTGCENDCFGHEVSRFALIEDDDDQHVDI